MHRFTELAQMVIAYTISNHKRTMKNLGDSPFSASRRAVVTMQALRLQTSVVAVGLFSMFEAMLQDALGVQDGFAGAKDVLDVAGESELRARFELYIKAINVLKHGEGRSYNELLAHAGPLPFRVRKPGETYFLEGDVSEVRMLIDANDEFLNHCGQLIRDVSSAISTVYPNHVL